MVDTVKTILENFVFIIFISKKIFDITGIDVMDTEIKKTNVKANSLLAVPIKLLTNMGVIKIAINIGMIVAPTNNNA